MQRLGRKGHPTYRIVVQDSRYAPTSGKYVALLGSYDPHTKTNTLKKDKAQHFLDHGAQPSDRVVKIFKEEKIKLPKWVKDPTKHERAIRNPEKLRKNQPATEEQPDEVQNEEADNAEAKTEDEVVVEASESSDASEEKATEPESEDESEQKA